MCQLYRNSGILNLLEPCPGLYRDCFTFTLPVAIYRRHKPKIHVYSSQNIRTHVDHSAQLFTKKETEEKVAAVAKQLTGLLKYSKQQ
jgi:hypothetical protein